MGNNAFAGCELIDTLVLPYTLTNIGTEAFKNCNLSTITVNKMPTVYGVDIFKTSSSISTILYSPDITVNL